LSPSGSIEPAPGSSGRSARAAFSGFELPFRYLVGVADMKTASDPRASIVTHSLGSCVAVAVYDPVSRVGGMLHFQLPSSEHNAQKAVENPCMFADTGIPLLMEKVCFHGARKERLKVKLVGGANIMDRHGVFNIGVRNYTEARRVLCRLGVPIAAEDVGGESWRTVELEVGSGRLTVRNSAGEYVV